jgi:hypothetical protein
MKRILKRIAIGAAVVGCIVVALVFWVRSQIPSYPYGWSHCCLKGVGVALGQYAEKYNGHYPAGAGSPEASLSLLYREGSLDAEYLRGKTVPVEKVKRILERGELLGPDSCGWHYVEGLTTSDDPNLALVWDKVGLGHNGEDLHGGHSVWFLGYSEEVVPAEKWPDFLKQQQKLMAARRQPAKQTRGSAMRKPQRP